MKNSVLVDNRRQRSILNKLLRMEERKEKPLRKIW